jgi:hypothetical protein
MGVVLARARVAAARLVAGALPACAAAALPACAAAALPACAAAALLACAAAPPPDPASGRATAWGFLRLVPREGVTPRAAASVSPYADPALRDVEFVGVAF